MSPTTRRLAPLLCCLMAGLLAAACASKPAVDPTVEATCRQAADEDPKVKSLMMETFNGINADPEHFQQLKIARYEAYRTCLVAHGVNVPGGVEPVLKGVYVF